MKILAEGTARPLTQIPKIHKVFFIIKKSIVGVLNCICILKIRPKH